MSETTDDKARAAAGSLMRGGRLINELIGIVSTIISAGAAVVSFIKGVGGPAQFLVEVAFYGFACYIACFVTLPIALFVISSMDRATKRESSTATLAVVVAIGVLGGGALFRFGLFAKDVTHNLDGIGTAFGVICGLVILLIPVGAFWYLKGSKPAS